MGVTGNSGGPIAIVNVPGEGETKTLGSIHSQRRGYEDQNGMITYNTAMDTSNPISLKETTLFFEDKVSTSDAPNFNATEPYKISEFSSMKSYQP